MFNFFFLSHSRAICLAKERIKQEREYENWTSFNFAIAVVESSYFFKCKM